MKRDLFKILDRSSIDPLEYADKIGDFALWAKRNNIFYHRGSNKFKLTGEQFLEFKLKFL